MIVTGFEPADILFGIYKCVWQLESGIARLENAYKRAVSEKGNPVARKIMDEVLEPADREWRGIGHIPLSGFALREKYAAYDAFKKFPSNVIVRSINDEAKQKKEMDCFLRPSQSAMTERRDSRCIAGEIMKGNRQVADCPHFGTVCNPNHPLGASMVSEEGVCAAYYNYQ